MISICYTGKYYIKCDLIGMWGYIGVDFYNLYRDDLIGFLTIC
jgi:hypothetical protein